ncbi:MAG: FAD-binding protein [Clostridia bacterium]|nr:FAD-binding protein [Clostridia bacterium]
MYDLIIIGAGPAGIFTALELLKNGSRQRILIAELGVSMENRHCPKDKTQKCVNCKPSCYITTGFSGAGAFSDGKLSLSCEVGGDLPRLLGEEKVQALIDYTDTIYLEYGADPHVEGITEKEKIKNIRLNAIRAGLKLVDCPIRHLGTEMAHSVYSRIQQHLLDSGVEIRFRTQCSDLIIEDNVCRGVVLQDAFGNGEKERVFAKNTVVAAGRVGASWLEELCRTHGIERLPGTVDVGVRVEVRNEVMEEVNQVLYESKLIGYPKPFENKVRTFCQNPGGYVSQENYDDALALVNGHSFKEKKSENTNVAILCSHHFRVPFDQPILYAQKVGQLMNMLANGSILVQRYGDILSGKRTWAEELERSNVRPTLKDAVAGDLTSAMPYRTMVNIISFIAAVDKVVPGFASDETLLYGPEIKFYSNCVKMDENLKTSVDGLYCLGDSSGWTRGLMMSSAMGVYMARKLWAEEQQG